MTIIPCIILQNSSSFIIDICSSSKITITSSNSVNHNANTEFLCFYNNRYTICNWTIDTWSSQIRQKMTLQSENGVNNPSKTKQRIITQLMPYRINIRIHTYAYLTLFNRLPFVINKQLLIQVTGSLQNKCKYTRILSYAAAANHRRWYNEKYGGNQHKSICLCFWSVCFVNQPIWSSVHKNSRLCVLNNKFFFNCDYGDYCRQTQLSTWNLWKGIHLSISKLKGKVNQLMYCQGLRKLWSGSKNRLSTLRSKSRNSTN